MASVAEDLQAPIEDGQLLDPINLTPRVSRGNNPVPGPRKNSDTCTAVQSKKRKREGRSSKLASKISKASKKTPL
jgi:hypothetical protein